MLQLDYQRLLALARRASNGSSQAEDLLQDALIESIRAGRQDFGMLENRRWLGGVIRNKAKMLARGETRRRRRETAWSEPAGEITGENRDISEILTGLPPALKALAALVLTGHNRREITYLLGLEDTALRQRVSQLRKRFAAAGIPMPAGMPGLSLDLAYGRIRDVLLPALLRHGGILASHDPDGHLFVVRRSQKP
jgi:RNA polymerase sigma-70 factor (ECF subfamily)